MKHFRIVLLFTLVLSSFMASAQFIAPLNVPKQQDGAPEWTRHLYATPLNIWKVDSAYEAFYASHPFVKDNYTKYYKRLRRLALPYIQTDGVLREQPETSALPVLREKQRLSPTAGVQWKPLGPMETYQPASSTSPPKLLPWQCNVYAFDISKSNPSILYAVSETGGFFKSTNKGQQWQQLEPGIYSNSEAVAIHPSNPNVVYVGINGGVVKTADGGTTWTSIWKQANLWVYDIEVHANQPTILYAATNQGFYRSSDAGATWSKTLDRTCCELESNAANHNEVYTLRIDASGKHYEFWKSVDGGLNFSIRANGWLTNVGTEGAGRMTVSPADPQRIYAVLLGDSSRPYILRSDDAGEHWRVSARGNTDTLRMSNGQGYYDLSIAASHIDANLVIVGTTTAYRSSDGANTFPVAIGGYTGTFSLHPDIQEMKCMGADCYVATDGGFNYSNDLFDKNWDVRTSGLNGADFWGFDCGWNEDVMVGGRYHNGNTAWREGYGSSFFRLGGGEAATGYVNPMNARHTYHSDIGGVDLPIDNAGRTSSFSVGMFPNESYYPMEYSQMVWDPRCASTVWIGSSNSLYRSVNNARSYSKVWSSPDNGAVIQHIEISRSNPKVMYVSQRSNAMQDGKIWKTVDEGLTWTELKPFPGTSGGQRRVMRISLSSSNENILYAVLLNGRPSNVVFRTSDGGNSWKNMTTPTIGAYGVSDLIMQHGTNEGVYLASHNGRVFYRNADMSDWELHGSGLPYALFTRGMKAFYRDNKLRTGSTLGIWEAPLYEHSKPEAQPCVDKRFTACERDTFYFDDYSVLERANARWHWSFPGAIYVSDSTIQNPKVIYSKPGSYAVSLEVSNDYGKSSKTISAMVQVLPSICGVDSVADKAADLGAKNDMLSIAAIPQLKKHSGLSVCCWLKLDTIQSSFSQILSNWASDVGFSFGFSFQGYRANTNLTFYWKNVPYQLTSAFNLPVQEWVHVAITVAKDRVTLYANGVPWAYTNASADFEHFDLSATPWEIGGGLPGQGGNYRGQIEELQIFNRVLDSSEVRARMHLLYEQGTSLDNLPQLEPPVAYYQFNEADPTRIYSRYGTAHADNSGAVLVRSTAPVGRGMSSQAPMLSGVHDFASGATIYRTSGLSQHIVVSRLESPPDSLPSGLIRRSPVYWIIHAYPANKALDIDSIRFLRVGEISDADQHDATQFRLYRRASNEHRNNWLAAGRGVAADSMQRSVLFGADSSATAQYVLATVGSSPLPVATPEKQAEWYVLPQPANDMITVLCNELQPCSLRMYDMMGRLVHLLDVHAGHATLSTTELQSGMYQLELHKANTILRKSVLVVH